MCALTPASVPILAQAFIRPSFQRRRSCLELVSTDNDASLGSMALILTVVLITMMEAFIRLSAALVAVDTALIVLDAPPMVRERTRIAIQNLTMYNAWACGGTSVVHEQAQMDDTTSRTLSKPTASSCDLAGATPAHSDGVFFSDSTGASLTCSDDVLKDISHHMNTELMVHSKPMMMAVGSRPSSITSSCPQLLEVADVTHDVASDKSLSFLTYADACQVASVARHMSAVLASLHAGDGVDMADSTYKDSPCALPVDVGPVVNNEEDTHNVPFQAIPGDGVDVADSTYKDTPCAPTIDVGSVVNNEDDSHIVPLQAIPGHLLPDEGDWMATTQHFVFSDHDPSTDCEEGLAAEVSESLTDFPVIPPFPILVQDPAPAMRRRPRPKKKKMKKQKAPPDAMCCVGPLTDIIKDDAKRWADHDASGSDTCLRRNTTTETCKANSRDPSVRPRINDIWANCIVDSFVSDGAGGSRLAETYSTKDGVRGPSSKYVHSETTSRTTNEALKGDLNGASLSDDMRTPGVAAGVSKHISHAYSSLSSQPLSGSPLKDGYHIRTCPGSG